MPDILDEIVQNKRNELELTIKRRSLSSLKSLVEENSSPFNFYEHLQNIPGIKVIAECKSKSPSQGIISNNYDPVSQAIQYQKGGAAAISILTEEKYFGGHNDHLRSVANEVSIPVLRKDFIIDEYQIYEARYYGASSFLLIAGVLDTAELQYFIEVGRDLGMEPLVESYSDIDLQYALGTDAKIFGVNNRNLKTMDIDFSHILHLKDRILESHPDAILVCESGVNGPQDVQKMAEEDITTFLIGGYLMKAGDPVQALLDLTSISW